DRGQVGRDEAVAEERVLPVCVEVDLVALTDLRGETGHRALVPHREQVLLRAGDVEQLSEVLLSKGLRPCVVGAPVSIGAVDPQTVLDERSAERRVYIPDAIDAVAG